MNSKKIKIETTLSFSQFNSEKEHQEFGERFSNLLTNNLKEILKEFEEEYKNEKWLIPEVKNFDIPNQNFQIQHIIHATLNYSDINLGICKQIEKTIETTRNTIQDNVKYYCRVTHLQTKLENNEYPTNHKKAKYHLNQKIHKTKL
jgi:hypothetical protein